MARVDELVLVTGMTGAGRGTAAKTLEKLGYYVVDNLPAALLPEVVRTARDLDGFVGLAVVVDARSGPFFGELFDAVEAVRDSGVTPLVLYLEAADEVLVRRQEAARRPHPLSREGRLMDGFARERELLRSWRGRANVVIDTTNLNTHQLASRVRAAFHDPESGGLRASVVSFGFKYGLPIDADMVADMRFLPNPFWIDELRDSTGKDAPVSEFVLSREGAEEFLDAYTAALKPVLEGYQRENKSHSTVAVGCTGGRHRSVAVAEELARRLASVPGVAVTVRHRDLGRE